MGDVIVIFDTHGKFLGIAHDPRNTAQSAAVSMRYKDYERFLQNVPREDRRFQDAVDFGGVAIKGIAK